MPHTDHPLAFGQHSNSDMAASVEDANTLIDVLVSLQPNVIMVVDEDSVDPLAAQCTELLEQTPPLFDIIAVRVSMEIRSDPDPLRTVLYQELDRSVMLHPPSLFPSLLPCFPPSFSVTLPPSLLPSLLPCCPPSL